MLRSCAALAAKSRTPHDQTGFSEPQDGGSEPSTPLRNLPDAVARVNRAGRCSYANPALLRLAGVKTELVGQSIFDLSALGAAADVWRAAIEHVFSTGTIEEIETTIGARPCVTRFIPEAGLQGGVGSVLILVRDTSARRQAMLALRESEAKYRHLVEQLPVITYALALDEAGSTLFVSPQIRDLGYSETEYLTDPQLWYSRIHAQDRRTVVQRYRQLQDNGIPIHSDYRVYTRDGDIRWMHDQAVLVSDDRGRPLFIQGVMLDATDHKRTELDLQRIAHDLRERVKESRGMYAILTALHQAEAPLQQALQKVAEILPSTLQFANDAAAAVHLYGATYQTSGYRRTEREVAANINVNGETIGSVSVVYLGDRRPAASMHFVSEEVRLVEVAADSIANAVRRREAERALLEREAYYRSLIEKSADIVTILAADGTIQYLSPSVERMLGYAPDELLGTNILTLIHADDVEVARNALATTRAEGPERTFELRFRHKENGWRIIETAGRNLLDHEAVRGIVINGRDVTDSKRLEVQLTQSRKMEAVGRLAGGVAHDFNNILTAISGYAEVIAADLLDDDPRQADLDEIRKAANRAAGLTRQLLAFSRNQFVQPRVFSLSEVVSDTQRMLERIIGEEIQLQTTLEGGTFVRADRGQIEQVLLNLVVNARDATPDGGCIAITAQNREVRAGSTTGLEPGRYVLLSVADTGTGIPPEIQAQIFDPFFTTKEPGKGTGLGLSTVYGIVRQSGGRIEVTSALDTGTRFDIYLPRASEPRAEPTATAQTKSATNGKGTILVVEDEAGVRTLVQRALTRAGYTVIQTETAEDAVHYFEREADSVDLLLTDVLMPDTTGPELAARLTALRPVLPVLYMSGYTRDALSERGELGQNEMLIEKPFAIDALVGRVKEILDPA